MKTKIHLIAIFLLLGIYAGKAQEWGYVSTLTDEYMRKIWTQGLDTVYIVGENGLIARSTDQGETWGKQYFPTKVALNDIIFIDYYTGFAVGEQGAILKTTDAGETWKQIPIDATSNINAIAATGVDNIWAVGDNSLILHSTDTGETWEQENILSETNIQLTDIAFRGNLGYFTGNYGTIYKTEDYGVTWNKQTIIEQADSDISNTFYAINVMENKTYMIYHTMGGYRFFYTENQINWNNYDLIGYDGKDFGVIALFFLDDNQGYFSFTFYGATLGNINGSGYIPEIQETNIGQNVDWSTMLQNMSIKQGQYPINPQYLDIRFVNYTLGYAIFGQTLLRYPKPIVTHDKVNNIEYKNTLELFQLSSNELLIKSQLNSIKAIDIFDISGKQYVNWKWQNPQIEMTIAIDNMPKGVYLIRCTHENDMISIEKYIKR